MPDRVADKLADLMARLEVQGERIRRELERNPLDLPGDTVFFGTILAYPCNNHVRFDEVEDIEADMDDDSR